MSVKTYDPKSVHVFFGGMPISGISPENGIMVVRNSDTFELVKGINGVVSRKYIQDQSGSIKLALLQTSLSNDFLSATVFADEKGGIGIVPFLIIDTISKSTYVSAFSWVKKYVDATYNNGLSVREWIFDCLQLQMYTGGSADSDDINSSLHTIVSQ